MQILAGVVVIHKGKTLLLKNISAGIGPGKWGPPGGHGEADESIEETAVRETKEETNLDVTLDGIVQTGIFKNEGEIKYIGIIYVANVDDISGLKIQESEATEYVWATKEEIESGKYEFRTNFLKEVIISAFTKKPSPNEIFKTYEVEA